MSEALDPLSDRACRITHAYKTGIELSETLQDGESLRAAVSEVNIYMEHLEDGYPDWHPAPDSFRGMIRLFIYREITGDSYRTLETYQELAEPLGLDHAPDESVLSRTWRERFDDGVREYVTVAAHYVVKDIHDYGPTVPAVRPKEEVTDSTPESAADDDEQGESGGVEFSDERIRRTTRLARNHGFNGSIRGGPRTPPTRTCNSSNYRRSWGWWAVALLRVPLAFSFVVARSMARTVTRICERSRNSNRKH